MQVNKNISEEINEDAGERRVIKAKRYVREGRVNIVKTNYEDPNNFSITSIVSGNNNDYHVDIEIQKKQLKLFINAKLGQIDDPKNLLKDVSTVGHWGNGDYQIIVKDTTYLEYIMSCIKQIL